MVYRYIYMDITIYTNNYIDAWGYAYLNWYIYMQ